MKIQIISLFPEMFAGVFDHSMLFKAKDKGAVEISHINLRDFGVGPRKQVDDTPYGGGDGMLLKPEPLFSAIESAKKTDPQASVVIFTPRGQTYKQSLVRKLSQAKGLILVCGRHEGIDERVMSLADYQISIGNYVLTGGEFPAMVVVDSVVRLLPGVLGGETSAEIESFSDDESVEYAQYTKPEEFKGLKVPKVLLSGNHAEIAKWREEEAKQITDNRRQDME